MVQPPRTDRVGTTGLVLVHGGVHQASAWDPLLPHLRHPALAVDLPGRGIHPADLTKVGVETCIESICTDISAWGVDPVVLVGHSLAGVTVPLVAERMPDRVVHVVLLSAIVPPSGRSVIASLRWIERVLVSRWVRPDRPFELTTPMMRYGFGTNLSAEEWRSLRAQTCPEAPRLLTDVVHRRLPADIPFTFIVHTKDRALSVKRQHASIRNLDIPIDIRTIDAGHSAFASHPVEVATLLDDIADIST
jgi:pimeloyl-ACP methyl ester carboxylesterase